MRPLMFHVHGIGPFDFSSLEPDDLPNVNSLAASQGLEIVPTVFLVRNRLPEFVKLLRRFHELSAAGELPQILGFAVEGPLLGPLGGVPDAGKWKPTKREWLALAELGEIGLRYIVMAPDGAALEDKVDGDIEFAELLEQFYDHGSRVALGHFHHGDPALSASRTSEVVDYLHSKYLTSPYLVLTDHLYNDMPRSFVHAWRTPEASAHRAEHLARLLVDEWSPDSLERLLGPVPAALLAATRSNLVTPCLNFDGMHVDLTVCRLTVDYVGSDRLIALTDHIEVSGMASERLWLDDSGLWRRLDGKVAAGSTGFHGQRQNMLRLGLTEAAIADVFATVPRVAIGYEPARAGR